MSEPQSTRCMNCGQSAGPEALNRMPSGEICPQCHERVLESLPSLLPGVSSEPAESTQTEASAVVSDLRLLQDDGEGNDPGGAPSPETSSIEGPSTAS